MEDVGIWLEGSILIERVDEGYKAYCCNADCGAQIHVGPNDPHVIDSWIAAHRCTQSSAS